MAKVVLVRPGNFNGPALFESLVRVRELFVYVEGINSVKAEDPYVMFDAIPRHDPHFVEYAEDYIANDKHSETNGVLFEVVEIKGDHYHIERDPITNKETIMDVSNMINVHEGIRNYVSPKYRATIH